MPSNIFCTTIKTSNSLPPPKGFTLMNKRICQEKVFASYSTLPVPSQGSCQATGSFLQLSVIGSGTDVNITEVLSEFTPKFLQCDVILDVNSRQGKSKLFWFGCGRERKYSLSSICNVSFVSSISEKIHKHFLDVLGRNQSQTYTDHLRHASRGVLCYWEQMLKILISIEKTYIIPLLFSCVNEDSLYSNSGWTHIYVPVLWLITLSVTLKGFIFNH